jgi:hypothetical protein
MEIPRSSIGGSHTNPNSQAAVRSPRTNNKNQIYGISGKGMNIPNSMNNSTN